MPLVAQIASFSAPWAAMYADSQAIASTVMFAHLGGMLVSGGLAVAADRQVLRAVKRGTAARAAVLDELPSLHRPVVIGLGLVLLSGAALAAADVETFAVAPIFWVKMALVTVLMINGLRLQKAEKRLVSNRGDTVAWTRLKQSAFVSLSLWIVLTLLGVLLTNAA